MTQRFCSLFFFTAIVLVHDHVLASTQDQASATIKSAAAPIAIYLDPGHGGTELGAVASGVIEANLMLEFSRELKVAFEKHNSFSVLTSRDQDQTKTLSQRVAEAHEQRADLFLSLHANSAQSQKAKGIEIFFQPSQKPSTEGAAVEQMIHDLKELGRQQTSFSLSKNLKQEINTNENDLKSTAVRIKQAPFYVLSKTQIPSVLIEIGFLTHPRERQKLQQKKYRAQIAEEIVMAVKNFVDTRHLQKDFSDKASKRILN